MTDNKNGFLSIGVKCPKSKKFVKLVECNTCLYNISNTIATNFKDPDYKVECGF